MTVEVLGQASLCNFILLVTPIADTRDFISLAIKLLDKTWRDGYRYAKAGVMLSDFYDEGVYQGSLFEPEPPSYQSKALITVIDKLNGSGKGKVWLASQSIKQDWSMKRGMLSPQYTTSWVDLPKAK